MNRRMMALDGVAVRLRRERRRAKLSRGELAELSGVTYRTILRIENGDHKRPQTATIRALADALNVELDDLQPEELAS